MTDTIEKRACEAAVYVIETGATVRAAARHLGISKSTVHKDLTQRLKQYNYALYLRFGKFWTKTNGSATSAAGWPQNGSISINSGKCGMPNYWAFRIFVI